MQNNFTIFDQITFLSQISNFKDTIQGETAVTSGLKVKDNEDKNL